MVRIRFIGPLRKVLGVEDVEVEGGGLADILERVSRRLGIDIFVENGRAYLVFESSGKPVRTAVSLLHSGRNVVREGVESIEGGTLEVITPLGGG